MGIKREEEEEENQILPEFCRSQGVDKSGCCERTKWMGYEKERKRKKEDFFLEEEKEKEKRQLAAEKLPP